MQPSGSTLPLRREKFVEASRALDQTRCWIALDARDDRSDRGVFRSSCAGSAIQPIASRAAPENGTLEVSAQTFTSRGDLRLPQWTTRRRVRETAVGSVRHVHTHCSVHVLQAQVAPHWSAARCFDRVVAAARLRRRIGVCTFGQQRGSRRVGSGRRRGVFGRRCWRGLRHKRRHGCIVWSGRHGWGWGIRLKRSDWWKLRLDWRERWIARQRRVERWRERQRRVERWQRRINGWIGWQRGQHVHGSQQGGLQQRSWAPLRLHLRVLERPGDWMPDEHARWVQRELEQHQ